MLTLPWDLIDNNLCLVTDARCARHAWTRLAPDVPFGSQPGLVILYLRHFDALWPVLPDLNLSSPVVLGSGGDVPNVDQSVLPLIHNRVNP
jgi:hypothetical protein